jgi:hypothetical protein
MVSGWWVPIKKIEGEWGGGLLRLLILVLVLMIILYYPTSSAHRLYYATIHPLFSDSYALPIYVTGVY